MCCICWGKKKNENCGSGGSIFTLKAKAAARRAALIFSGYSATLQLLFNWLPGWVNNEHVSLLALCTVMEKQ